jgi:hypothetical protein
MSDEAKRRAGALRAVATMHDDECPVSKALKAEADALDKKGPAKVNSLAYRENFESIFGAKQEVGQA